MKSKWNMATDAKALQTRIETHEQFGKNDINSWIFELLKLDKTQKILDLGCGTGKQTLEIARNLDKTGHIDALDISEEALEVLSVNAQNLGVSEKITGIHMGLDEIESYKNNVQFDRVIACYSLYYGDDFHTIFKWISKNLKSNGIFFFCGPCADNNIELKKFHYSLSGSQEVPQSQAVLFMENTGKKLANEFFSKVEFFDFCNPLFFKSSDDLFKYWQSYYLYDKNIEQEFKTKAERYFQQNSFFETTKRVLGIRAFK